MPELPEVQTVVNTLAPAVVGQLITGVTLHRTDVLQPEGFNLNAALQGTVISSVDRRGKRIVITLNDGNRFYIHLGMTGRLSIDSANSPLLPHTHLVLDFAGLQLRFRDPRRFGGIWWMGQDQSSEQKMGPEPLTLRVNQLAKHLSRTHPRN